jgi:hypothetical protein
MLCRLSQRLSQQRLSKLGFAAFFWADQCYNPHAHQYGGHGELYDKMLDIVPGFWSHVLVPYARPVRSSTYLLHAWAEAFGASPDAAASRHAKKLVPFGVWIRTHKDKGLHFDNFRARTVVVF